MAASIVPAYSAQHAQHAQHVLPPPSSSSNPLGHSAPAQRDSQPQPQQQQQQQQQQQYTEHLGPTPPLGALSPSDEQAAEACVQCLAGRKAQSQCERLRSLGFHEWQAAAAVHTYGSGTAAAIEWLLLGNVGSVEDAQRVVNTTGVE